MFCSNLTVTDSLLAHDTHTHPPPPHQYRDSPHLKMNAGERSNMHYWFLLTWESKTFCQKLMFLALRSERLLDHRKGLFRSIVNHPRCLDPKFDFTYRVNKRSSMEWYVHKVRTFLQFTSVSLEFKQYVCWLFLTTDSSTHYPLYIHTHTVNEVYSFNLAQ